MKNFKIIHIVKGRADPNTTNGVNIAVHNIASTQKKLNFDVEVWGITKNIRANKHKHDYPLKLFEPINCVLRLDSKLVKKINNLSKNTIIQFHSGYIVEYFFIAKILKRDGIKWVLTPHAIYDSNQKTNILKLFYKFFFEKFIINQASAIHALSKKEVKFLGSQNKNNKVFFIPNGIKKSAFTKKKYLNNNLLKICYCGRLAIYHKGLDLLLKSIQKIKERKREVYLEIIGDGNEMFKLKKMVKCLNIIDQVKFYGKKIGNEKKKIIINNDVFIHTSRYEGMPIGILEAASLGMPLIISKETNFNKYVERTQSGYVIKKLNVDNISKTIEKVIRDKNKKKIYRKGRNAYKMSKAHFSWNNSVELLNNKIYSKLKIN